MFLAGSSYSNEMLVNPQAASLQPGAGMKFEAQLFNKSNTPLAAEKYLWKVIPEDLGVITEDGYFIAGQKNGEGAIQVSATIAGQTYDATIEITIGNSVNVGISILLTPQSVVVSPLGTQQFSAQAFSPDGALLQFQNIRWMVKPNHLGTIDRQGNLTASTRTGEGQVVAMVEIDNQVYYGTAQVVVSPAANGAISGLVADNAGAGVADAKVTVIRLGIPLWSRHATSDESGLYTINRLIPGIYVVQAEASGYIGEYYNDASTLLEVDPVEVANGDSLTNINFNLTKGGSISGTVLANASGAPLAGAHVEAYLTTAPRVKHHTLTAEDGTYILDGLITGQYIIHANLEGYVGEYYNDVVNPLDATLVQVTEPNDTAGIDFSLANTSAITGVVICAADGAPISGAVVAVRTLLSDSHGRANRFLHSAKTNENGEYTISVDTGYYLVYCKADGYDDEWFDNAEEAASATPVQVVSGEHAIIDFALASLGGISGKVTNESTGEVVAEARVNAFFEKKHERRHFQAIADSVGNYHLAGLPAGEYVVEAHAGDYIPEFWQEADSLRNATLVAVKDNETTSGIDFTLVAGAIIKGKVTEIGTDTPLANAQVTVVRSDTHLKRTARTDDAGNYVVDGLPSGTYFAYAIARGYEGQWYLSAASRMEATAIVVTAPEIKEAIDFALAKIVNKEGSTAGTVLDDSTGLPIEGAVVQAMPLTFARPKQVVTGADGTYEITGLRTGIYVVVCWATGYKGEFYDDARRWRDATPIQVTDGEVTAGIDFGLSSREQGIYMISGIIAGTQGEPVEGALVVAEDEDQVVATSVSSADGSYELDDIPAGSYKLTASVAGYTDGYYSGSSAETTGSVTVSATESVYSANIDIGSESTSIEAEGAAPLSFALEQNYPNPFNPSTEIHFTLPKTAAVKLKVYNLLGEEVKTLFDGTHQAGSFTAKWDGTDQHGVQMACGIYLYRLEASAGSESYVRTLRMLMLK